MRTHRLKTWPTEFEAVVGGRKRFEFRRNDRDFAERDTLVLEEWDPTPFPYSARGYTGRQQKVLVTYIIHGGQYGIPPGFCVMSVDTIAVDE